MASFEDPDDVAAGGTPFAAITALQRSITAMIKGRVAVAQQHLDKGAHAASTAVVETVLAGHAAGAAGLPAGAAAAVEAVQQFITGAGPPGVSMQDQVQQLWTQMSQRVPESVLRRGFRDTMVNAAYTEAKLAADRCMGCVTPPLLQQLLQVLLEVSDSGQTV
jgi:hypothetical protein